jgi:carboxyl-terminal processing protease
MFITIQKFYRINGGTTQLKGVTPDILLPDPITAVEIGEREEDYPMPWTKINPASYTIFTGAPQVDKIIKEENTAVTNNADFKIIRDEVQDLKKQKNETLVPLNLALYKKQEKSFEEKGKKFNELSKKDIAMNVQTLVSDDKAAKGDTSKLNRNKVWVRDLAKDIYLKEAVKTVSLFSSVK